MTIRKFFIMALLAIPSMLFAEGDDDFGVWTEIGLEKSLSKHWSISLEGEYRSQERMRGSIGAKAEYKPCKYFKVGAYYSLIYSQKVETREEHYRKDIVSEDNWNGYDIKLNDWYPRHRAGAEMVGTVKLWHWLRISLRERYQMTYKPVYYRSETKYRYEYMGMVDGERQYELKDNDDDGIPDYPITELDRKDSETIHMLRSRLKLSVDKKGQKLSPFISAETHNVINDKMRLDKVRSAIGFDYKINKKNEISLSYILTCDIYDDEDGFERVHDRMHALGIGYNLKF